MSGRLHPKDVGRAYLRTLLAGPRGHYLQEFAQLWHGLEASSDFYVLTIEHTPFTPDAGRIYMVLHIKGLAAGITQSAEEYQITQWVRAYAGKHGMAQQIEARYLKPEPELIGGVLVVQTVLQMRLVVCHLLRGTTSLARPTVPDSAYQRTWRSADYPERIA